MDTSYRPDPDVLLSAVQKEENRQHRGKLKIFLGMAAGVGKTHAMLEAARQMQSEGVDVVVGYVETHERPETTALLSGLAVIPRLHIEYRGTLLDEMDTDAILARHPQLVLVDELAHSNALGMRHRKRYQDVLELLESGIHVYTTVNVQHFESRADAVRQITGIYVHERIPDSLLDQADILEVIDLAPEALRKRLAEGKVYTEVRAEVAADNFFRLGNLTALREMALRLTAEHVDHQLQDYMQVKHISGPWKSGERLMVAMSADSSCEQLIRWARRMAYSVEGVWFAAHVQTAITLSEAEKESLARNIALVRSLEGEVLMTYGDNIADALLQLAHQRNITQIIVGKSTHHAVQSWPWLGSNLADQLIYSSGNIDVCVVAADKSAAKINSSLKSWWQPTSPNLHYLWTIIIVAGVTAINLLLNPWFSYQAIGLTELFTVFLIAVYLGRGPALLAAALSALSWNYLFIPPHYTFIISKSEDFLLLCFYFFIALVTGNLTARIRMQERQSQHNANRTQALYTLAHAMSTAVTLDDVLTTAVTQIGQIFNAEIAILLPSTKQSLIQPHPSSSLALDTKELAVANWVFMQGRSAGRFTDSLPSAIAQYLPLLVGGKNLGVLGIRLKQATRLSADQELLLETFANQIALIIQRELLDQTAHQAALLRESERLYTSLLNSISHELRTPITTITGASSSLLDPQTSANPAARLELTQEIQGAAERLNRLVENLLDMSRLDAGRLHLKLEWCDIGDIIGVAVQRLTNELHQHPLTLVCPPDLPLIQLDFGLIEQVLVNLLDNACHYTPFNAPIEVRASVENQAMRIDVIDQGPGVPETARETIFENFYRLPGTATGGIGLGLSICHGLVTAHGGSLSVQNQTKGGAQFTIHLPMRTTAPPVREAVL